MCACHPRRKPLLKMIHKRPWKQFAEDMSKKHMDYWNHVRWSDERKINLFGSNDFKHVWWQPGKEYKYKCVMFTVKHCAGNVMVCGCTSAAAAGKLHFIEGNINNMYCEILQQSMTPPSPFRNWVAGQCPSLTMITNTPPKRSLFYWRGWWTNSNPIEHVWEILKWIIELRDVLMEKWLPMKLW